MLNVLLRKLFSAKRPAVSFRAPGSPELAVINSRLAKLEGDLNKAISGYRLMLVKENPDILPELITGDSIDDLDRSLLTAKELTAKIIEKLEARAAAEKIPGGAPARMPPDIENLPSTEKIKYGLMQK